MGAVLRDAQGRFLAQVANRCLDGNDPTGHAEVRALVQGAARIGSYRLPDMTMTISLEPCAMCVQALALARVGGVQFVVAGESVAPRNVAVVAVADTGQEKIAAAMLRFFFEQRRKI